MEAGLIGFAALLGMAFAGIHLGVAMFLTGFFGFAFLRGMEASASLAGTLIFSPSLLCLMSWRWFTVHWLL